METLAGWVNRIASLDHTRLAECLYRVFAPGKAPLDLNDWLIAANPGHEVPAGYRGCGPESVSLLRLLDENRPDRPIQEHQRLVLELAAAMTLALGRRIEIPHEIATRIEGEARITLAPYGQTIDPSSVAPLPKDPLPAIERVLGLIAGLPGNDQTPIGSAATMYHGALLLFDREIRAAYTLLVAGIEVLSRSYGSPPMEWADWDESRKWDEQFIHLELNADQCDAIRQNLLENKQLRLKATFRAYASKRLKVSFWSRNLDEWWYDINALTGEWGDGHITGTCRVKDVLPEDRIGLARSLGKSYDLRSGIVHQGAWTEPLKLALPYRTQVDFNTALPFSILREILGELIMTELTERSEPANLPDIRLSRPD